jgi:hypothetical protein
MAMTTPARLALDEVAVGRKLMRSRLRGSRAACEPEISKK